MRRVLAFLCLSSCLCAGLVFSRTISADDIAERAKKLHFSSIMLDTHDDTTQRFFSKGFDLGKRNPDGHIDIPRMRDGGMNAIFFSIWIDGRIMGPPAVQKALDQIDAVHESVHRYAKDLVFCRTAAEVREAHKQGKIATLIGVEGGHMIGNDIRVLRMFGNLGVRYMTLSHFYNDEWADSSTDKPVHNGLTEFGKDIVREMNRQGIMVDISHVSDKTFYDALEVSKAPLIASHSSCRAISNHPRNMTDQMIKDLAAKGGVIQINYHIGFLSEEFMNADKDPEITKAIAAEVEKRCGVKEGCQWIEGDRITREYVQQGKLPRVDYTKIIEHIDHAVKLVGAEHVGLGSDFDGANMPFGMEDATKLPQITEALLRKGYSEEDVRKILGENTLRLMTEVERVSRELNSAK